MAGVQFQWPDGLFGIALSGKQDDGYATLYFHPLSSLNEFSVSTKVLRNQTLATGQEIYRDFKLIGTRGLDGQSGASFLDKTTGIIFYTLPNQNGIGCWRTNSKENYTIDNGHVFTSSIELVFPNDVKVDDKNRLWALSDNLQQFIYGELDRTAVNYRILSASVSDAVRKTACEVKTPLRDIIPNLVNKVSEGVSTLTKNVGNSNGNGGASSLTVPTILTTVITCLIGPMILLLAKHF